MVNFVADSESLRSNVVIDNLKQIRRRQRTDEYSERHDIEHIYSVNIFEYEKAIYRRRRQPHTGRDQLDPRLSGIRSTDGIQFLVSIV
jgi:hypothetical protein